MSHFDLKNGHSEIGEGSVHYSMKSHSPGIARKLADAVPTAKFIYLVRHPLDRILSHYRMYERACDPKFTTFEEDLVGGKYFATLLEPSMYWLQISEYLSLFPEEQIKVVFFEDFAANPYKIFGECCKHIDVALISKKAVRAEYLNRNVPLIPKKPMTNVLSIASGVDRLFCQSKTSRTATKKLVTKGSALWSEKAYAFAVDALNEDTSMFLDYVGKQREFWAFDLESANRRMLTQS